MAPTVAPINIKEIRSKLSELHGHNSVVLGAWGGGVFGNDPSEIAGLIERALEKYFTGTKPQLMSAIVVGSTTNN